MLTKSNHSGRGAGGGGGGGGNNHTNPPSELDVPKEMVDFFLRNGKAIVVCEAEKRTRSDVWKYFGRVRLIPEGSYCKDVVACQGCMMVYLYRSKSQGTSTLRHHKCSYVFQVLGKDMAKNTSTSSNQAEFYNHSTLTASPGQGDGRELTPEGEDLKHIIPTPPPLKEHVMNSPPPQQPAAHPALMPNAGGLGGVGRSSSTTGLSNLATPPPPVQQPKEFSQQLLCVRWGNYDSNIVSMFSKLRNQEQFVDLTLWCEGRTIKCHKMILSACSTYFEQLLTENQNLHPIIFLKDMRFWEIQALVEFMYKGEVSIHQDKLQSLLRAAESLQIKGLGSPSNDNMAGNGSNNSSVNDDDLTTNSTVDMSTSTPNPRNNNNNNNNNSIINNNNNNSIINNNSTLNNSNYVSNGHNNSMAMNMGMDLSNHGSNSSQNIHNSGSAQSTGGGPTKRRKKETPRRIDIDIPRALNLNPIQTYNSHMRPEELMDDDDPGSDDSMTAHERNNLDLDGMKSENQSDMQYEDSNDGEGDNYGENERGSNSIEDDSNDQNLDDEEMEGGAISLRMNVSSSDRDRERSRKGNPIKKIIIGNNNNNNETGNLQTSTTGD